VKKEQSLPKKSELLKEQAELSNRTNELVKEMQEREYEIDFKHPKVLNSFISFLEKDAPWGHTTATGLIMLYNNLRQQKQIIKQSEQWDGKILLRSANVNIMWSMLTKMTGSGFYQAKSFVELMVNVGESLSTAVNKANLDNQELRIVHTALNEIDNKLSNPEMFEDDCPDEEIHLETQSLEKEINPTVESL